MRNIFQLCFHNLTSGYYLYMESSAPATTGQKATLVSPQLKPDHGCDAQISFYYNMFGTGVGSLYVQASFIF